MPLYEYECKSCNKTFEMLQRINAEPLTECVHCQGDVEKLISVSSFQFKGSGWYITDYKNKSSKVDSSSDKGRNIKGSKNASTNK
ncbi:MAG: zinc ribbon domain-containing protein [bacterium]|nr:zinc ribbon domain-containing protein [bacterium]